MAQAQLVGDQDRIAVLFDAVIAVVAVAALLTLAGNPAVRTALAAGQYARLASPAAVYLLLFFTLAVVWANHHQLLAASDAARIPAWATLHVLFWISLYPAVVAPLAALEGPRRVGPYAVVMTGMAGALLLLRLRLHRADGGGSIMAALNRSGVYRSLAATLICAGSIPLAMELPEAAMACFLLAPLLFLIPEPNAA